MAETKAATSRAKKPASKPEAQSQPAPTPAAKPAAQPVTQADFLPPIHHIVRTLAAGNPPAEGAGSRPVGVDELDAVLGAWLQNGYVLASAHVLGVGDVGGTFITRILYIVVRREYMGYAPLTNGAA